MSRIGQQQLRLLIMTASPTCMLVTTDKTSASLVKRGLLREERPGGACAITPAGLRVLADEMSEGRVASALDAMRLAAKRRQEKLNRKAGDAIERSEEKTLHAQAAPSPQQRERPL